MNKTMLRIGQFARIGQVAVATLRHYDKIGLLKPAHVDAWTGYRYYAPDQLPQLNRILALKDLGLSLEQIARMLEHTVTNDDLRAMLRLRHAQLVNDMRALDAQLARVEARIHLLEQENTMTTYDVVLKTVSPLLVAGRRIIVTENNDHPHGLPEAFAEAGAYVAERNGEVTGACIAVWYTPVDATTNEDVEAAVPLKAPIASNERVVVHDLPQANVAAVVHQGDFRNFMQSYQALLAWIEANGYRQVGPFRELYHNMDDTNNVTVEVQFPVEKQA